MSAAGLIAAARPQMTLIAGLTAALHPAPAWAHLVGTRFGDFYAGALHPITALEHLVPWLAMGMLAGAQGARASRGVALTFPIAVILGALLARIVPSADPGMIDAANIAAFLVLGGLIAAGWALPRAIVPTIAGVLGVTQGYGNGLAMSEGGNLALFVAGVTTAGCIIVVLMAAATVALLRWRGWTRTAVRAAGSWIAAVGVMMTGLGIATL